ncbi:putative zinc-type alcohol dehydrogenase-like protein [Chitinophaga skermanii]|uniref:Putative zinc-type alcohol dehydrogenase-like protein n=1 Tax=Chitinophaga skermanii TaxID=331697 RepID=A0A327R5M5_9BACT|nr:NAD(P)-dependent alcohol dehydrogenase [Chitinophaga skermanii]RAJ10893.1 putative zinc-type alcohol dehydrogenase-like protein [Chitinophaga skermanii]
MIPTKSYAVHSATDALAPWDFERRDVKPHDVLIEILYCGVCHSDIHQVRGEWGNSMYPMVPGHEIVGKITQVGEHVKKFKVGDLAGIGCMVDSCRECGQCKSGYEQFCEKGQTVFTYNSRERDGKTLTFGGYSNQIVCDEAFVVKVPANLPLEKVAPLLCAGITTYSPIKQWGIGKGHKVAVLGLGGLGHMAVKFAASMGAEVTMLSTSPSKEADARKLGATHFVNTKERDQVRAQRNKFDFIIDTVSAPHNYDMYLNMLKTRGAMICVGIPPEPISLNGFLLLGQNRILTGSSIGGIPETQEMLDYCGEHNITSDVEVIDIKDVNEAYERVLKSDVKYRFVIDMATLK